MTKYIARAAFTDCTIRVYQAYRPEIARPALKAGRFVPPFKMGRMTWIKPSFNWMMYRSGYAFKPGQEYVLGIDITRVGFEWALENAVLSTYNHSIHGSDQKWEDELAAKCARVQWDPERDWKLGVIEEVRSIQIGLSGEAVERYVNEWIVSIEDVTPMAHKIAEAVSTGIHPPDAPDRFEHPYPLDSRFSHLIPCGAETH